MKLQGFNELNVEENLESKLRELSIQEQKIVAEVWNSKESFTRWPKCSRLLLPGVTRPRKGFHSYPLEITKELKARKITIDRRTNGPAIMSTCLLEEKDPEEKTAVMNGQSITYTMASFHFNKDKKHCTRLPREIISQNQLA